MRLTTNGAGAPGHLGPGASPVRLLMVALVVLLAAGCGPRAEGPVANPSPKATKVSISAADRAACAQLLVRLVQVTQAISASSELLTNSLDKQQLAQRIVQESAQLQRAADLMAQGPVPAPLAKTNQDLVVALRTLSQDFGRAKDAASRGDYPAAVEAMRDEPAVQRIVVASQTIEASCRSA